MRSRYFGPARPIEEKKDWLAEGYNVDSWSRDQSQPPPIYLRPRPEPEPIVYFYSYIDSQGYPYDLQTGNVEVDLQLNKEDVIYDLNG